MAVECNGWQRLQLSKSGIEFVDGDRSSKYPKQSEFQTSGIPFLNTTSTSEFRLDLSQVNFVTPEKYSQITKGRAQRNDLLLTTRGSNTGKVALFNCEYETGLINAQMLILRADPNRICPAFLFYQFRTVAFQLTLKAYSSGSAQPHNLSSPSSHSKTFT
jgi:type I restriction enzyme, S subunit